MLHVPGDLTTKCQCQGIVQIQLAGLLESLLFRTCSVAGRPAAASPLSFAVLSVLITLCTARCAAPTVSKLWVSSASSSERRAMALASADVSARGRNTDSSCCRAWVSSEDRGEAMQPSTAISRALLRSTS